MYDVFTKIRNNLEDSRRIPTRTLLTLNPSSQVCYDMQGNQLGSCLRQVWLEKNDQPKSNAIGVNAVMAGFSGNWWEDWFITQLKSIGVFHSSGFPLTDVERLVKGIVDVSILNFTDNSIELGEVKTYDGSNYAASSTILGSMSTPPKPRDKHLLQAFRYSIIAAKIPDHSIKVNNLFYIDRSCGAWYKNKQFRIELVVLDGITFPQITTVWKDEYYSYVDTRISDAGVYSAEEKLLEHFGSGEIPDKEFIEAYTEEMIKAKALSGDIPDYVMKKHNRDPVNNPIGDFQCKYCAFSKGTCATYG